MWEDETGVGRYQVHVYSQPEFDGFTFHYWTNHRFKKEILERDPMKSARERVLQIAKNPVIESEEQDLESYAKHMDKFLSRPW